MGKRSKTAAYHRALAPTFSTHTHMRWQSSARKSKTGPGLFKRLQEATALPNGEFNLRQGKVLGILLIVGLLVGGVFAADQAFKSPNTHGLLGGSSVIDPTTTIWRASGASSDLGEFNTAGNIAAYQSNCVGASSACVKLTPSSTVSTEAVTKSSIGDLSIISKQIMRTKVSWTLSGNPTANIAFGWYLTRNVTVRSEIANYDPMSDPNVVLLDRIYCNANCANSGTSTYNSIAYLTRTVGTDTISGEGPDICNASAGAIFLCVTNQQINGVTTNMGTSILDLNFTGTTSTAGCSSPGGIPTGSGCSFLFSGQDLSTTTWASTTNYPWLQYQTQQLYMGFYVKANLGVSAEFTFDNSPNGYMYIAAYNPSAPATPAPIPASPDTGGFFGPVIKALIAIGIFILSSIAQFFGYVYTAFKVSMDAVGNFLGVGAIGTNIANALGEFASWVTSIFAFVFSNVTAGTTFIINSLTTITNFIGNWWTQVEAWLTILQQFSVFFWTVVSDITQYGTFGGSMVFIIWWTWGMFMALRSMDKWMAWAKFSSENVLRVFKLMEWFYEKVLEDFILRFKRICFQWI